MTLRRLHFISLQSCMSPVVSSLCTQSASACQESVLHAAAAACVTALEHDTRVIVRLMQRQLPETSRRAPSQSEVVMSGVCRYRKPCEWKNWCVAQDSVSRTRIAAAMMLVRSRRCVTSLRRCRAHLGGSARAAGLCKASQSGARDICAGSNSSCAHGLYVRRRV